MTVVQEIHAHLDETPLYLATVYEIMKRFDIAEHFYLLSRTEAHPLGRHCNMITAVLYWLGARKYAQNDYAAVLPLLAEAEQLAQQYE